MKAYAERLALLHVTDLFLTANNNSIVLFFKVIKVPIKYLNNIESNIFPTNVNSVVQKTE